MFDAQPYQVEKYRPPGGLQQGCTVHGRVLCTHLALKRFHRQVDNHVRFKRLLLNKGLEADVALERAHTGVNQHVSLQVRRKCELTRTHVAFVFLHTLREKDNGNIFRYDSITLKVTFIISRVFFFYSLLRAGGKMIYHWHQLNEKKWLVVISAAESISRVPVLLAH